jgi:hypothetical protein
LTSNPTGAAEGSIVPSSTREVPNSDVDSVTDPAGSLGQLADQKTETGPNGIQSGESELTAQVLGSTFPQELSSSAGGDDNPAAISTPTVDTLQFTGAAIVTIPI